VRAVICESHGDPKGLRLAERPAPEPGPGEVVIRVAAAGVNFADTLMVAGRYQATPPLPFTPGLEAAGTVAVVGPDVNRVAPGDRVAAILDHGGFAEAALARAADVFLLPDSMDATTAAGFPIAYGTAHGALVWRARLQPGETLLVNGAAGGAGLAAVEVGKALGARVIATAGGPDKCAIAAEHGADRTVDTRCEDLREAVKALTDQRGADVVYDPVGGDLFHASLHCTAWSGRIVTLGFASGRVPDIPANILMVKNLAVLGLYWGSYRQHAPALVARQFGELFRWYEQGLLRPLVGETLDLSQAAEALARLKARQARGKVVLRTDSTAAASS